MENTGPGREPGTRFQQPFHCRLIPWGTLECVPA